MMKRRSARDNALNSPTLLLLGSCLGAAFPRKTRFGWGELLGAVEGGGNNRNDVSGVSPVVQTSSRTSVLLEDATDAANSAPSLASSLHPSFELKFHKSYNFYPIARNRTIS